MFWGKALSTTLLVLAAVAAHARADDSIPDCLDLDGSALPVMNSEAAQWKHSEPNQWRHRARLQGYIDTVYADHSGHHHFGMQISGDSSDDVEVIYNEDFGPLPDLQAGMRIEACGDFIVATAAANGYPPSPLGALIHWVHMNPDHSNHPPGYLWINGTLCGQDPSNAGPKRW